VLEAMFVFDLQDSVVSTLTFLNEQSGILTLISILSAIGVFFYQQHNEKNKFNERIVNASKALIADLEGLEKSYSSGIFPRPLLLRRKLILVLLQWDWNIIKSLSIPDLYYTMVKEPNSNFRIFYYNMSLFNEWIKELNHVEFFSSLQGPDSILILDKIAQKLTNHEKEIKLKIPVVKILLYEEIKKFE
jgi:hypothetical protein